MIVFTDGISEQHLVARLQDADAEARALLYEQSAGVFSSLCRRYITNEDDARDILHDLYVKIFCNIDRFTYKGEGSLYAWMSRALINLAINTLRGQHKLEFVDLDDKLQFKEDPPDVTVVPSDVLHTLIGELPDGYRTVLNLYALEGFSHKEIALKLGIRESTSASQYLRAKSLLQKNICEYIKRKS